MTAKYLNTFHHDCVKESPHKTTKHEVKHLIKLFGPQEWKQPAEECKNELLSAESGYRHYKFSITIIPLWQPATWSMTSLHKCNLGNITQ